MHSFFFFVYFLADTWDTIVPVPEERNSDYFADQKDSFILKNVVVSRKFTTRPSSSSCCLSNKTPTKERLLTRTMSTIVYIVYDFETTGTCMKKDVIIQMAMQGFTDSGRTVLNHESKLRHLGPIDKVVLDLTNLSSEEIKRAKTGEDVFNELFQKVLDMMSEVEPSKVIWIAHNGKKFDEQMMIKHLHKYASASGLDAKQNCSILFERKRGKKEPLHYVQDTLELIKERRKADPVFFQDSSGKNDLQSVFDFIVSKVAEESQVEGSRKRKATRASSTPVIEWHKADGDVKALRYICEQNCMKPFLLNGIRSWQSVWDKFIQNARAESDLRNNNPLLSVDTKWTAQQKDIIGAAININMSVIAGAGCAKTTTILGRIMYLIYNGIDPMNIFVGTYNKAASIHMRECFLKASHCEATDLFIGTLDQFTNRMLETFFDYSCSEGHDTIHYSENRRKLVLSMSVPSAERTKMTNTVKYLFVDEAQDLSFEFFPFLEKFYQTGSLVTFVGDDAQNIYSFIQSTSYYLTHFQSLFANSAVYQLTTNFRSTSRLIALANESLRHHRSPLKTIVAGKLPTHTSSSSTSPSADNRDDPFTIFCVQSEDDECEKVASLVKSIHDSKKIPFHEIAILARDNKPLYRMETCLAKHKIECHVSSSEQRASIANKVVLSTIHGAKGLEYEIVILVGIVKPTRKWSDEEKEEERRVFYTAITRAKLDLYFTFSNTAINDYGRTIDNSLSAFITELPSSMFQVFHEAGSPALTTEDFWPFPSRTQNSCASVSTNAPPTAFPLHKMKKVPNALFPNTIVDVNKTLTQFNSAEALMASSVIQNAFQTFAALNTTVVHRISNISIAADMSLNTINELNCTLLFFVFRCFSGSGSLLCAEQQFSQIQVQKLFIPKEMVVKVAVGVYKHIVSQQNGFNNWSSGSCLHESDYRSADLKAKVQLLKPLMTNFYAMKLPVANVLVRSSSDSSEETIAFLQRSETAYRNYQTGECPCQRSTAEEMHARFEQSFLLSKLALFREGRKRVVYESPVFFGKFCDLLTGLVTLFMNDFINYLFSKGFVIGSSLTEMHLFLPSSCSSHCYGVDVQIFCHSLQAIIVIDPLLTNAYFAQRPFVPEQLHLSKMTIITLLVQAHALRLANYLVKEIIIYNPRLGCTVTMSLDGVDLSAFWDDLCRVIESKPVVHVVH